MNRRNIAIVLVNWRRSNDTCACIESLLRSSNRSWSVLICENGSLDGSEAALRSFLKERFNELERLKVDRTDERVYDYFLCDATAPQATLIVSPRNLGFAGGNNIAYKNRFLGSDFDYVWFLNNDTEIEPLALDCLISRMEQDRTIGICGSTLVFNHDRKSVQAFGGATYSALFGSVQEIGNGKTWPCDVDQNAVERDMSYVSGASMIVSAVFLEKVGLMAEDYFLYYEEIDWAERARHAGFRLGYAKEAVVYHKEGSALGSGRSQQRSALAEYYGVRNRLVITRRFFPWALPTVFLFCWLQVAKRLTQGHWSRARLMAGVLLGIRRSAPDS